MTHKMTQPEALLPCPFCGGDPELDTMQGFRAIDTGKIGNRTVVYCTHCPADVGMCHEDVPDMRPEDLATIVVGFWNARAALQAQGAPAQPDHLREALAELVAMQDELALAYSSTIAEFSSTKLRALKERCNTAWERARASLEHRPAASKATRSTRSDEQGTVMNESRVTQPEALREAFDKWWWAVGQNLDEHLGPSLMEAAFTGWCAALEAQGVSGAPDPVAEVLWWDPRLDSPKMELRAGKIIDASIAWLESAPIGTKLYATPESGAPEPAVVSSEPSASGGAVQRPTLGDRE